MVIGLRLRHDRGGHRVLLFAGTDYQLELSVPNIRVLRVADPVPEMQLGANEKARECSPEMSQGKAD